jgi:hypothetical protein
MGFSELNVHDAELHGPTFISALLSNSSLTEDSKTLATKYGIQPNASALDGESWPVINACQSAACASTYGDFSDPSSTWLDATYNSSTGAEQTFNLVRLMEK